MYRNILSSLFLASPGAVTLNFRTPLLPIMKHWINLLIVLYVVTVVWASGCSAPLSPPAFPVLTPVAMTVAPAQAPATMPGGFSLHVDELVPGSVLPDAYTCKGAGESPELSWENVPKGTKSLVLIVDDPDAPKGTFTHWLLYNIPPQTRRIDRAQPNAKVLPGGAQQGDTSTGSRGYFPPCPPIGPAHRYVFSLYAVDYDIGMPTADRAGIDWAMSGHVLGQATVTTTFGR